VHPRLATFHGKLADHARSLMGVDTEGGVEATAAGTDNSLTTVVALVE
jgi:hypothetical protein